MQGRLVRDKSDFTILSNGTASGNIKRSVRDKSDFTILSNNNYIC